MDIVEDIEQWKDIEGYEGLYQVSSWGRVYSLRSTKELRTTSRKGRKYKYVQIYYIVRRTFAVARLVAKAFIPNIENKCCVNHIDGDPSNNHVSNLEWVNHSENGLHAWRTGLQPPSPKRIEKVRELGRSQVGPKNYRSQAIIDIVTGDRFDTLKDAAKYAGICRHTLRFWLTGRTENQSNLRYYKPEQIGSGTTESLQ